MAYEQSTDALMRENDKMLTALKHIAAIAHTGGFAGLDEFEALCAVRRLTLKYWDKSLPTDQMKAVAVAAFRASDS